MLIVFSLLFIYSITVQLYRLFVNLLTPKYKKTPEYRAFEKELNKLVTSDCLTKKFF